MKTDGQRAQTTENLIKSDIQRRTTNEILSMLDVSKWGEMGRLYRQKAR